MTLTLRPYQHEEDYWRIRAFLREICLLDDRREMTWQVARLDYWRWHVVANCHPSISLERQTFLWETEDGRLAAVLNLEGEGDAQFQVHPAFRSPDLIAAMLPVAEQHLAARTPDGASTLILWVHTADTVPQGVLAAHGYRKGALARIQALLRAGWAGHGHRACAGLYRPCVGRRRRTARAQLGLVAGVSSG